MDRIFTFRTEDTGNIKISVEKEDSFAKTDKTNGEKVIPKEVKKVEKADTKENAKVEKVIA